MSKKIKQEKLGREYNRLVRRGTIRDILVFSILGGILVVCFFISYLIVAGVL